MPTAKPIDLAAVMARIFTATGCRTQRELGKLLGVQQSSIACAVLRRSVPDRWLLWLLREKGINPDWILSGQGARLLLPAKGANRMDLLKTYSTPELVRELIRREQLRAGAGDPKATCRDTAGCGRCC